MIYLPKYLAAHEVVDEFLYDELGDNAFKLFDADVLRGADWLRERYGTMICNNWKQGGHFSWRGFRTYRSDVHNPRSMHSHGKALDLSFIHATAEEIREDIKLNGAPFITRIEDDVSWIHIDTKGTKKDNEVYFFKP